MKTVKYIICILLIVFCISMTACFNIFGNEEPSISKTLVNIIINDINEEFSYTVVCGEKMKVDTFIRSGFYLLGIFDSSDGSNKYFDSMGISINEWESTNPNIFYTKWASINGLNYTSIIQYTEANSFSWKFIAEIILPENFYNAIKGNIDKYLEITATFDDMDELFFGTHSSTHTISIVKDLESYNEQTITVVNSYNNYIIKFEVPAICANNGKIYCEFNRGNTFNHGFIKNLVLNVKFKSNI